MGPGFESQRDHERENAKPLKGLFLFEDEGKAGAICFALRTRKEKEGARRNAGRYFADALGNTGANGEAETEASRAKVEI